ncbi:MAG TPA: GGDEF domain-containing protein [Candidatus Acidoferrum sp.]|nr:GGDEF domain-containing protein [Candidatus Acidoferrum sp.]
MAQPGEPSQPQPSSEESFLDLLVETLEGLEESVRGQFLRQFFRTLAQVDLSESQSNEYWRLILQRRRELSESIGKRVSLQAVMVDVLASTSFLRVPILMEYEEFKKLQINAATDALTGLYNRRLFDEYCDKELNRAKRYSHQLAVVILDLHRLKEVNDQHGHLKGDQVLQLAASTLRKTLRSSDFAFRIGGDEFALLLPQTDSEQALTLCRRLRVQYEAELGPMSLNIPATLDFGVSIFPEDAEKKNDLLAMADKRLYQLKSEGRVAPRVIPLELRPSREAPPTQAPAPPPVQAVAPKVEPEPPRAASAPPTAASYPEKRKWERVSLAGTKAYAVISEGGQKTAKVIDLSYGGVSLLLDRPEEVPQQFSAVLHVPILPPVRVVLRRAYAKPLESGRTRLGCSFVS